MKPDLPIVGCHFGSLEELLGHRREKEERIYQRILLSNAVANLKQHAIQLTEDFNKEAELDSYKILGYVEYRGFRIYHIIWCLGFILLSLFFHVLLITTGWSYLLCYLSSSYKCRY